MKYQTNDLLKSAVKLVSSRARSMGIKADFGINRFRSDLSPKQNFEALKRYLSIGRFELCNDVNSGTRSTGYVTRFGDAAIAQYLLVQKGASAPTTNVAVFTSGTPFGTTDYGGITSTTQPGSIRLLVGGVGTGILTSDGSAAIAVGDIIVGVSGGKVKTNTATATTILQVGFALEPVLISATTTDAEFESITTFTWKTIP